MSEQGIRIPAGTSRRKPAPKSPGSGTWTSLRLALPFTRSPGRKQRFLAALPAPSSPPHYEQKLLLPRGGPEESQPPPELGTRCWPPPAGTRGPPAASQAPEEDGAMAWCCPAGRGGGLVPVPLLTARTIPWHPQEPTENEAAGRLTPSTRLP